jgi:hypothetical protein
VDRLDPLGHSDRFREFPPMDLVIAFKNVVDERFRLSGRGALGRREVFQFLHQRRQIHPATLGGVSEGRCAIAAEVDLVAAEHGCGPRPTNGDVSDEGRF